MRKFQNPTDNKGYMQLKRDITNQVAFSLWYFTLIAIFEIKYSRLSH